MDNQAVDRELVEVYNELIGLVQEAKQAAWQATDSKVHDALEELLHFLVDEARRVEEAEEAIDGRSAELVSPTGQKVRNLRARAGYGPGAVNAQLLEDLQSVATDIRTRGRDTGDTPAGALFDQLADGLERHIVQLREHLDL